MAYLLKGDGVDCSGPLREVMAAIEVWFSEDCPEDHPFLRIAYMCALAGVCAQHAVETWSGQWFGKGKILELDLVLPGAAKNEVSWGHLNAQGELVVSMKTLFDALDYMAEHLSLADFHTCHSRVASALKKQMQSMVSALGDGARS